MSDFQPIPNPYIVGNPIKSRKMFYGREDDFDFIRRKLEKGGRSYVIVLCGERRSGKTSILFQILNGELGDNFLPILIDMQTMAGLRNDAEFFDKVARETYKSLQDNRLELKRYNFFSRDFSSYKVVDKLLDDIHALHPDKNLLFLIDEYELIESKIEEKSLSINFIPFLAGVLESGRKISFILTGSKRLDEREGKYWQILFGKALYRSVSFLSERDTLRLVTEPVENYVTYDPDVLTAIFRLTAGQPFYTQVVCQNIVDHLNEWQKSHVTFQDLETIVDGILENPLPQMIYFWNSLSNNKKLILSLMAEILENPVEYVSPQEILKITRKRKFGIETPSQVVNTTLENLFHNRYVKKKDGGYNFQMDLFRRWIQRDHSIWRVMKEVGQSLMVESERLEKVPSATGEIIEVEAGAGKRRIRLVTIVAIVLIVAGVLAWFFTQTTAPPLDRAWESVLEGQKSPELEVDGDRVVDNRLSMEIAEEGRGQLKEEKPTGETSSKKPEEGLVQRKKSAGVTSKVSSDPELETHKDQAMLALEDMRRVRIEAERISANLLAQDAFRAALARETEGQEWYAQKRFREALLSFREARKMYASAAAEARAASGKYADRARILQERIQQFKGRMKSDHRFLEAYQKASNREIRGEQYMKEENYFAAVQNYEEALQLIGLADEQRKKQIFQIRSLIADYIKALERKDLQNMSQIYLDLEQERWLELFENVEKVQAEIAIEGYDFEREKARVLVSGNLSYTGFISAENRIQWEIWVRETSEGWRISEIKER